MGREVTKNIVSWVIFYSHTRTSCEEKKEVMEILGVVISLQFYLYSLRREGNNGDLFTVTCLRSYLHSRVGTEVMGVLGVLSVI